MQFFAATSLLVFGLVVWVASALHVVSFGPLAEAVADEAPPREWAEPAPTPRRDVLDEAGTIEPWPYWPEGQMRPEIPVPTDAHLVRGTSRAEGDGYQIQVELAVPVSAADALTFYREQLSARGWEEVAGLTWRPTDGHHGAASMLSAFCRDTDGPMFLVDVAPKTAGTSHVHVRVTSASPSLCASPSPPIPPLANEPDDLAIRS